MTPDERQKAATVLAGIAARGLDIHFEAHGPDGAAAVRTQDGSRWEVAETMGAGAMSFVEYKGERFAVNVIPLASQDGSGPLFTYRQQGEAR